VVVVGQKGKLEKSKKGVAAMSESCKEFLEIPAWIDGRCG